ncbi:VOC family protein [Gynurincola endophyticus]|jgi:catechol 2,3-dioxygenase-like lactoylglutathione lyase family enzyme|uniref:VOC family protein n=1 Tax=Gynurincola endophyticus TaxID=2479004 RepID=UPI000F8F37B5|nr:VOC family protein [Gynurincola endophyticus]
MYNRIASFALVVKDYDEAIDFYVNKLGFDLIEDTVLSPAKRWVQVAPKGAKECTILLAKASSEIQEKCIGHQTGGRVGFFMFTDDFDREYTRITQNGVEIVRPPVTETHGKVAVFKDLYGNQWDLIEPTVVNKGLSIAP